ncbi:hypothetical protein COHA_007679 [Chlorella ohadii]|uniref:Geranyl diphosphate synthase n=1 Tax=Chlorella ohadii TaxID=2649997 RepID=A0AAD5GZL4_9CHLO|nr:hypothetical protein COHA_007679 [Chlorella ohadii]
MRRAGAQLGRCLRLAALPAAESSLAAAPAAAAAVPAAAAWVAGPAWRRHFVSGTSGAAQAEAAPKPAIKEAAAAQPHTVASAAPQGEERKGPFGLVREEIDCVTERLRRDIFTEIPALERAAEYFFQARMGPWVFSSHLMLKSAGMNGCWDVAAPFASQAGEGRPAGAEGKRLRSTMLLLMSSALAPAPAGIEFLTVDTSPPSEHPPSVRRRQQRIAEITELIHVASLLHDDVIDSAGTRRGKKSLNAVFGNKVAILAGDFLLARASVSLAALRNPEAIMLMSQSLEHLVAGEILQASKWGCWMAEGFSRMPMSQSLEHLVAAEILQASMECGRLCFLRLTADAEEATSLDHYMRKTYCKTASLMANSCKAVAVLGGHKPTDCHLASEYGRHVGLAFQLVDDIMDFTSSADEMGKPAVNDLRSGLATAPTLYAAEEFPELLPLIQRRFKEEGDVEAAEDMVRRSRGLERARELAAFHAADAAMCIESFSPAGTAHAAEHRAALIEITHKVLNRKK